MVQQLFEVLFVGALARMVDNPGDVDHEGVRDEDGYNGDDSIG